MNTNGLPIGVVAAVADARCRRRPRRRTRAPGAIWASAPNTALAIRKPVRPARRDRRRQDRVDDGPGRRADLDRPEVALVVGRVAADQVPDAGVDRRLRERERRVDRAPDLRRRALEVDDHPVAVDGDRDRDRDRVRVEAVLVDVVGERVDAVGHRRDRVPGEPLGLVEERGAGGGKVVDAVSLDEREVAALAGEARGDLGADVAEDDVRHPDVLLEQVEQRLDRLAPLEQLDRRDPDPLLVDLGRVRAVAARGLCRRRRSGGRC